MRIPSSVLAVAGALLASPLAAQVGHPPHATPYRDIVNGMTVTFLTGDVGGNGGKLGIGPHHGQSYGARFDLRISGPVEAHLGASHASLDRLIVSTRDSVATRVSGPVSQGVTLVEAGLQFNLTGRKTWHHLAPFFGGSLGLATASDTPADSSGYTFGSKFFVAPEIGMRVLLGDRLQLRADARALFWKLKYPTGYLLPPTKEPTGRPLITDGKLTEGTGGHEFRLGIALSF
jgi:hypothetical protein